MTTSFLCSTVRFYYHFSDNMHNLAVLARRFEEKRAIERAAAQRDALECHSLDHTSATSTQDEASTGRNEGESASPRNWSVPTNRFSEPGSRSRNSQQRKAHGVRRSTDGPRRVLVVPLEEEEPVTRDVLPKPALPPQNRAPSAAATQSVLTPPAMADAVAVDRHRGTAAPLREEREASPMASLAWVSAAPLPVSPPPLSLATDEDGGWAEVYVNLSSSASSSRSSVSRCSADSPRRPRLERPAVPVLVDFYVERDDAPASEASAHLFAADTSISPAPLGSALEARTQYEAVRRTAETLSSPWPVQPSQGNSASVPHTTPATHTDAPEAAERELFRNFLDNVTGVHSTPAAISASPDKPRPLEALDDSRCRSRLSSLHESAMAEVDQLQWELVQELCYALRPLAKVLLLRLMTVAEASHTATYTPSTVPIAQCVETINTLFAERGVCDVRATSTLCQMIAAYQGQSADSSVAPDVSETNDAATTRGGGTGRNVVEYATFVSHILEVAYAADNT